MKWFQNLRIRAKLFIGFGICIVFAVILSAVGMMDINTINNNYVQLLDGPQERLEHLLKMKTDFMTMRYRAANFVMNTRDPEFINSTLFPQYKGALESFQSNLDEYIEHNDVDKLRDPAILAENDKNAKELRRLMAQYAEAADRTLAFSLADEFEAADDVLKEVIPLSGEINALIETMLAPAEEYKAEIVVSMNKSASNVMMLLAALTLVLVVFACVLAIYIGNTMSKSISNLGKAAKEISQGNLNLNLASNIKDETGDLTRDLGVAVDTINTLIVEMNTMANEFEKGDMDAKIDVLRFQGAYKSVAEGVNGMFSDSLNLTMMFLECMTKFGNGNFDANIPQQPGKKAIMNQVLEDIRKNIKAVADDLGSLVNDSIKGKLSVRADVNKYQGGWAEIMDDLNKLLDAVIAPIQEASEVLQQVSIGNFDRKVIGDYQGDHQLIKNALNNTITNVASYIDEISKVLYAISKNDLDQSIEREYVGKFSEMKDALNEIVNKFNHVISDISSSSDQVAAGAKQISENSMTLAQGAGEQAASVEELNATLLTINENTSQNAENAKEAESLSNRSKNNAAKGDQDMNNMLAAMEGIKASSNSISKIIKVIDDIAFQTNLLALNAAVEAARAGVHGKGFAVVAEEVRSLAARSQNAAKETSELIEESINRVSEGTKIAGATANALQTIVDDIAKIADIITNISAASKEQSSAIAHVTEGLSQITEVVQSNSATSEEAASASQQLSSQAELLQNMVSVFELRRDFR